MSDELQQLQPLEISAETEVDLKWIKFPKVDHGLVPKGNCLLIMGQHIPALTKGGIALTEDFKKTEGYQIAMGRVESMGPLAFKDKESVEPWKEGNWCEIDDVIFLPRTGHRIQKHIDGEVYSFVLISDVDVLATVENLNGFSQFNV